MTTTKVSNVEFDTSGAKTKPPVNRPGSSSRPGSTSSTSMKKRSNSASGTSGARPVLHQPCSSTLGKFHDAVNFSLLNNELSLTSRAITSTPPPPLASHRSNTPRSDHPVLVAKQKYKYMTKQKSFVDESLFGGGPSVTNRSE